MVNIIIKNTLNEQMTSSPANVSSHSEFTGWFAGLSLRGAAYVRHQTDRENQRVGFSDKET